MSTFTMKDYVIGALSLAGIFALGAIIHESGRMLGDDEGYERHRKEMASQVVAAQVVAAPEVKEAMADYWQERRVGSLIYFSSIYASPPLLNEFGVEGSFHYLYAKYGTYAFPANDFSAEQIISLIDGEEDAPKDKFFGAKPQKL